MTSPAIAKPRGVLKIPTNEKIKPKAHNTQPSPGTQLKISKLLFIHLIRKQSALPQLVPNQVIF